MVKDFMTFHSLPYEPRKISATEAVLERIYEAAKKGLRGDSMALAAGLTPHEYRALVQLDPIAEYAETKGRADGEAELADVMMAAARSGDTKAAMDMLKFAHKWTAPQSVQVEVNQTISITAALEEAKQRVIEGLIIDANPDLLGDGRAEADGDAMGVAGEGRPADVREVGLPVG
jgi:hypothetical protein